MQYHTGPKKVLTELGYSLLEFMPYKSDKDVQTGPIFKNN